MIRSIKKRVCLSFVEGWRSTVAQPVTTLQTMVTSLLSRVTCVANESMLAQSVTVCQGWITDQRNRTEDCREMGCHSQRRKTPSHLCRSLKEASHNRGAC